MEKRRISLFHNILLPVVSFSCLNRDQIFTLIKGLFEISRVEITRVDCIIFMYPHYSSFFFFQLFEHDIYMDLDTIVQVVKPKHGCFMCTVYRLSGDPNQIQSAACSESKSSRSSSHSGPIRHSTRLRAGSRQR